MYNYNNNIHLQCGMRYEQVIIVKHTVPQTIRFQNSLLCLLNFDGNMMCATSMYYIPK